MNSTAHDFCYDVGADQRSGDGPVFAGIRDAGDGVANRDADPAQAVNTFDADGQLTVDALSGSHQPATVDQFDVAARRRGHR